VVEDDSIRMTRRVGQVTVGQQLTRLLRRSESNDLLVEADSGELFFSS